MFIMSAITAFDEDKESLSKYTFKLQYIIYNLAK